MNLLLTSFLVAMFSGAAFVHLWGPQKLRETYARWGYPDAYRYAAAFLNLAAALLLAHPLYRMTGAAIGALVLFVGIVMLLDHREYGRAASRFAVLAALWFQVITST